MMCGFDETRELFDFMAGRRVPIWDIPKARKLCIAHLNTIHPWLKSLDFDEHMKPDAHSKYIKSVAARCGMTDLEVSALKPNAYKPTPISKAFG